MYETDESPEACVKRGAEFLDEVRPVWAHGTDRDTFDMRDCYKCALGQLYGEYCEGLAVLDLANDNHRDEAFGFDIRDDIGLPTQRIIAYAELTRLWLAEIDARTQGSTP